MSHGLTKHDHMISVRSLPWHELGTVLKKNPKSVDEALRLAKLQWEVVKAPMFIKLGKAYVEVPDYYVTVRKDTKEPLAPVHERYEPVQNRDAFNFLDSILGSLIVETAGSLHGGRKVWMMTRLPEYIEVGGDKMGQYAAVTTGHDAKQAVMVMMTPIRIVCANTLSYAIGSAQKTYTVRHLGNPSAKLAEAREALGITINYYKQFQKLGNKLATKKLTDRKFKAILEDLYGTDDGMGDRTIRNRERARQAIMGLFKGTQEVEALTSPATVGNAPGTAWAAVNAVAEYQDHYSKARSAEGVLIRQMQDPGAIKQAAFERICAAVGVVAR